jgi:hypothetical protein
MLVGQMEATLEGQDVNVRIQSTNTKQDYNLAKFPCR